MIKMVEFEIILKEIDQLIDLLGGYWDIEWLIHPVIEELGEFSKELQIYAGLHSKKVTNLENLHEEFGDLLFAVLALGRGLEIDIEKAIFKTINKYQIRDGKTD